MQKQNGLLTAQKNPDGACNPRRDGFLWAFVEDDLVRALSERPDLMAILDVTYPEPPVEGHGFYSLPNCLLTSHIAGSSGKEVERMAAYMAEELRRYLAGEQTRYEVSEKMLETMA
jgi:phosphoglycerate dehydrogenase-like enzyme